MDLVPRKFDLVPHLGARFDWMEITFDDAGDRYQGDVAQGGPAGALAVRLGGCRLVRARGRNGYAIAWQVVRGDDVLATVFGHGPRFGEIHAVTSGVSCDEVVPVFRELWPVHRVSRADSSVDFVADFDVLDSKAVSFASRVGISWDLILNSEGGATRSLGSRKSENYARVYKKSEQLRALFPEKSGDIPDGVVRFELECKPGKRRMKEALSTMSADDLWGLGQWTHQFALEFLAIDSPRVSTHFRRPADYSRSLHYLAEQYGPLLLRRVEDVGLAQARQEALEALGLA